MPRTDLRTAPPALFLLLVGPAIALLLGACEHGAKAPAAREDARMAAAIEAAMNGPHRSPGNIARNAERHPVETLLFFGLEPDMTVIEASPGGLWYTEILAPVLSERGHYIAAAWDPELPDSPEYQTRAYEGMLTRFREEPEVFGGAGVVKLAPPASIDLGPSGYADMILTFRNTHGWLRDGSADRVYAAFFDALKPGGILGVVQHRKGPKTQDGFSGYVDEDELIALATRAGFVLEARSEINANPRDTADHAGGVWTLPPSFRLGDQDREKY
ncbi:MAG TPA: methyltransferase, partial [Myxococcota bacterium]|nr:methyltransferase [Myxococcota bacterium]